MLVHFGCVGAATGGPERSGPTGGEMIFGKTQFFSFLLMLVDFGCVGAAAGGPERSGPTGGEMIFGKTHFFSFLLMLVDFGCVGAAAGGRYQEVCKRRAALSEQTIASNALPAAPKRAHLEGTKKVANGDRR